MARRNCRVCTNWLHAHEFPYRTATECARCARELAWADHLDYQRKYQRWLRERRKVLAGVKVWTAPLRHWLVEPVWLAERPGGGNGRYVMRCEFYGLDQLATWAHVDEKVIRQIRDGKLLAVKTSIVDGILLLAPAAPAFDTLYPPSDLDPALLVPAADEMLAA